MRRLLLAAAAALAITAPAGAETIWSKPTGKWVASLSLSDVGPICTMGTQGRNTDGNPVELLFAAAPRIGVVVSYVVHGRSVANLTGLAVMVIGSRTHTVQFKELEPDGSSRGTGGLVKRDDASAIDFLRDFANATSARLILPSGEVLNVNMTGTKAATVNMLECVGVVEQMKRQNAPAEVSSKPGRRV
jgi:hypothetical protein